MIQTTITLTKEQRKAIEEIAKKDFSSRNRIYRLAVEKYIQEKNELIKSCDNGNKQNN